MKDGGGKNEREGLWRKTPHLPQRREEGKEKVRIPAWKAIPEEEKKGFEKSKKRGDLSLLPDRKKKKGKEMNCAFLFDLRRREEADLRKKRPIP